MQSMPETLSGGKWLALRYKAALAMYCCSSNEAGSVLLKTDLRNPLEDIHR